MKVYCEWYNNNGSTFYTSMDYVMTDADYAYITYIIPAEGGTMPVDTYRVVIYTEDGTVLADEMVTVS